MDDTTNLKLQKVLVKEQKYDVFVVYDESDDFAKDGILVGLEEENITFRCMERHGDPGNTIFEDYRNLILQCRKILFIISKHFNRNDELVFMTTMAFDVIEHDSQKVITLLTDGIISHKNGLSCLSSTTKVSIRQNEWKTELIQAIKMISVDYCTILESGNVSDVLLLRGLVLLNLRWEAYGLLIVANNRYLKVDLVEFSKHLGIHQQLDTCNACKQCGFLSHVDTTINLAFCNSFSNEELSDINDELIKLSVGLLNTQPLMLTQTEWLIVCSVSGLYERTQQQYVSNLFAEVKCAVETHYTTEASRHGSLHLPDYVNEETRLKSFEGVWPSENVPSAELMAKSGFVFMMKPDVAQCFSCGYNQCLWDAEKDPLVVHAQVTPSCNFVRENVSPDKIPTKLVKSTTTNMTFSTLESRLKSLKSFDILDLPDSSAQNEIESIRERLAKAGFYFIGYNMVKCYCCGISVSYKVKDIESDIWNLHGTLSPNCEYLLKEKGCDFIKTINHVQKRNNEPTIVTLLLLPLKGKISIDWPGSIFLPGERYKLAQTE